MNVKQDINLYTYSHLNIIKYPIITDKATRLLVNNQYSFAVNPKAYKLSIKTAIEFFFNVKAVFILVYRVESYGNCNVKFWLRKIKEFNRFSNVLSSPPPVLLVGTHLDHTDCTPSLLKFVQKVCLFVCFS